MTIYDDYIAYHEKYTAVYGEKTIVFLQVGDFFELYAVQNEQDNLGPDMFAIGDMCNLVITRKNKSIPQNSRANPLMAGFPIHAYQKQAQILVNANYTVVIIRQVTPPPNPKRDVTEIISPSTYIGGTPNATTGNALTSFLVTFVWSKDSIGIAGVDLCTGSSWIYETLQGKDIHFARDEAYRLLQVYQPREVLIRGSDDISEDDRKIIVELLDHPCMHVVWETPSIPLQVQNAIIEKAYNNLARGLLSPIEHIGIEKYDLGRMAFIHVLQFAYEHNETIIQRLQLPKHVANETHLTLEYNSTLQLNVISLHSHERSLLQLLNRTSTALGNRRFRQWLLTPLIDPVTIQKRYDLIQTRLDEHENGQKDMYVVASQLRKVMDLERALRRMILCTFAPMEWVTFDSSIEIVKELIPDMRLTTLQHAYQGLNLEECSKYGLHEIKTNVFHKGIHPDIDACMDSMKYHLNFLEELVGQIGSDICKLDCNERDGYYISITKRRWETFLKSRASIDQDTLMMDIPIHEIQSKPISTTSSVLRLSHPRIENASSGIIEQQRIIQVEATKRYKDFLAAFVDKCQTDLLCIADQVAEFDVVCTCARNAKEYGYCRPEVLSNRESSCFTSTGIRHPIIERIQQQVLYVKNDIAMANNGVLLYGVNSSGKSSFMKAIGLNIIMAQAGMYVAASTLHYTPYHHIFTRITGSDNIYRGMSSFVVEMTELRNILQRADQHSLVLGDELCAGTEAISAISIVAAGVKHLIDKKVAFLFATHLHELTDVLPEELLSNNLLQVAHMHIAIEGDKIIYDRKLQPGKGSPLYGLEVCNALALPEGFLKDAHQVRKKLMNIPTAMVDPKQSRYNPNVLMHKCGICGGTASETHHIRHQATAQNGFIEQGVDIHHAGNLIPLCEECHLNEHHGKTPKIVGYQQTSSGIEVLREEPHKDMAKKQFSGFEDIRKMICYMPSLGWKKKTLKGVWRACSWDVVRKELQKHNVNMDTEDNARWQFLARV